MNLGIYKPYKKVFFGDDSQDLSAVSYEVANVARTFADRGHRITMLSPTDLTEHFSFANSGIYQGRVDEDRKYDRIILFSGTFKKDEIGVDVIPQLRGMTPRLDFLLTDLRLTPPHDMWRHFNHVYTQATKPLDMIPFDIPQSYGGVAEFLPFQHQFRNLDEVLSKKNIDFYFGGTERGRLADFLEYVWRPDCKLTGKSDTLNFDTRVDRHEYMRLLDRAKTSITIADEEYNNNHFITPRHFEHVMHDIISFVDVKFDPDQHLMKNDDLRRVSSYVEMVEKRRMLLKDEGMMRRILEEQRKEITPQMVDGSYVYDRLCGNSNI